MTIVLKFSLIVLLGVSFLFATSSAQRPTAQIVFLNSNTHFQGPFTHNPHPVYEFAKNLYTTVANSRNVDDNIVISPFSIRTILALLYIGARGQTATELRDVLNFPMDIEDVIEKFSRQIGTIESTRSTDYKISNGIFVMESEILRNNYTRQLKERLKSNLVVSDFSDPTTSSKQINNWISQVTNGRISNLVSPSAISHQTSVLLANALYFSGKWEKPFEPMKEKAYFNLQNGRQVQVNMMQLESNFDYGYVNALKATGISIPFKDERFKMIILKPQDGQSLLQVENLLRKYNLHTLSQEIGENRNVVVTMPKFKLDMTHNLASLMKKFGITSVFDSATSDLSGMFVTNRKKGRENHVVNQMVHQAVLDINEKGATAAAGSSVGIYPISSPSLFTVDRPFIFLINDELTGPIFIGRVMNPSSFASFDATNGNRGAQPFRRVARLK